MNENIINNIDQKKLEQAIELLKKQIGEKEAQKMQDALSNSNQLQDLMSKLGKKEMESVLKVMNNPEALKMILTSQKAKDGIKNFLK